MGANNLNTNDYLLKYLKTVSDDPVKELIDNSMYYMLSLIHI